MADPVIVAEELGKRFGDVTALDGVDLELPAGGVLGVLGPNGAGKTTTVATMPGWLQAFAKANPVTVVTGALRACASAALPPAQPSKPPPG